MRTPDQSTVDVDRPPVVRSHPDAGNRLLWTIVGAILLAGGVLAALASKGVLGVDPARALVPADTWARWQQWRGWGPAGLIAGGVVLTVLGLLLLRRELRGPRGRRLPSPVLPTGVAAPGRTVVTAAALRKALTRDLRADRQVTRAVVHLNGRPRRPTVSIRLGVTQDADIGRVHDHVDAALGRLAATSGVRPAVREVLVAVSDQPPSRVV